MEGDAMKIHAKEFRHSPGCPPYIRYEAAPGDDQEQGPSIWKFNLGWHFFLKPIGHDPVIIREFGGGWYLRETAHNGCDLGKRVAGPFPCRKAAIAAWKVLQILNN
jgi:hypothetical protein